MKTQITDFQLPSGRFVPVLAGADVQDRSIALRTRHRPEVPRLEIVPPARAAAGFEAASLTGQLMNASLCTVFWEGLIFAIFGICALAAIAAAFLAGGVWN